MNNDDNDIWNRSYLPADVELPGPHAPTHKVVATVWFPGPTRR